jgi:hypothetical protein
MVSVGWDSDVMAYMDGGTAQLSRTS